jgi:pyruvate dehydrogenase E1 component alpha subunit
MNIINNFTNASFCRNFENYVYKKIEDKTIKIPVYLSAGQEFIPSTIASYCRDNNICPNVFIQHRGHSTYLSFKGSAEELIDELLGLESGCSFGMGGSASIQSIENNIFGHDGLMGSQVPIAVGHCYETKKPTIVFMGDAAAEEDYVSSSIGWASTKKLPILFVVEDNNLSILTEKIVRRNWNICDVANGYKVESFDISDDPIEIYQHLSNAFRYPLLLNIRTIRKYWHAGAGKDGIYFDRYELEMNKLKSIGIDIHNENKQKVEKLWLSRLEKQSKI